MMPANPGLQIPVANFSDSDDEDEADLGCQPGIRNVDHFSESGEIDDEPTTPTNDVYSFPDAGEGTNGNGGGIRQVTGQLL